MKALFAWLMLACLVIGCSDPDVGPPLGDFPAITKAVTDAPFTLTAPTSRSPASFTFTSSDPNVATIEGATVTVKNPGTSTITAAQASHGSYGPTSKATTLTVTGEVCATGQVRINGICQAIPTCVSPATLVNNECIAPKGTTITAPGIIWFAVTASDTWANASSFCTNSVINDNAGWRQPTAAELMALQASTSLAGSGWMLGETWSASAGASGRHQVVNLQTGAASELADTATAYVSCVKSGG